MEGFLRILKELLGGVQRIEGKGRSIKYIVYFDEVTTSKAFSTRSIRRHSSAAGGDAEASIPTAISIVNSSPHSATEEPHEQESDDVSDGSSLSCHGVQWKAVDGIVEDWRSSPQFGTHILWGNDVEEVLLEIVLSITNAAGCNFLDFRLLACRMP